MSRQPREADLEDLLSARKRPRTSEVHELGRGADEGARAAVTGLLLKALEGDHEETLDEDINLPGIAQDIEEELYSLHGHGGATAREYKSAVRNLTAGLKRNSVLRARVCLGEVMPSELVHMDSTQLAPAAMQVQLAQTHENQLRRATINAADEDHEVEYTCPSCKSTACSYIDSSRRDIGKSSTWGSKDREEGGRAVTCLLCGHKWLVDDV